MTIRDNLEGLADEFDRAFEAVDSVLGDYGNELVSLRNRISMAEGRLATIDARVTVLETTPPPSPPDPPPPPPPPPDPDPIPDPGPGDRPFPTWPPPDGLERILGEIRWSNNGDHIHDVHQIVRGGHGFRDSGRDGLFERFWQEISGGDGGKPHDGMVIRDGYLRLDAGAGGGHVDGYQFQGSTDWLVENVVIDILNGGRGNVTSHFYSQTKLGGGRGYRDVRGVIDGLKLVGKGHEFDNDLWFEDRAGFSHTITIRELEIRAGANIQTHPRCTLYVDDSVPRNQIRGGATVIPIDEVPA